MDCNEGYTELWDECYSIEETDSLDLSNSGLSGELPDEIGLLTNLTYLDLSRNLLSGDVPDTLATMIKLQFLKLNDNQFTTIPETIGNLENLSLLWISSNQLHRIPQSICNLNPILFYESNDPFYYNWNILHGCNYLGECEEQSPDCLLDGQYGTCIFYIDDLLGNEVVIIQNFPQYPNELCDDMGCMDINACNYDSTAIIEGKCVYIEEGEGYFLCDKYGNIIGDMNEDGVLNILDVVSLSTCVLSPDDCLDKIIIADVSKDGVIDILDITMLIYNILGEYECNDPEIVNITISDSSQNDFILSIDSVCVKGLQISLLGNFTFEDVEGNFEEVNEISEDVNLGLIFNWGMDGGCIPYEISMHSDTNSNESFEILDIIAAGCTSYIPVTFIDNRELKIENSNIPSDYYIGTPYPNPFNPTTTIFFSIPEFGLATITVYDLAGRELETLTNEVLSIGNYSINWNASSYPSGVYLIRMDSGDFTQTQKVVLVK